MQRSFSTGFLCAFLFSTVLVQAQNITGSISGTVRDSSGAVIPSATVRLEQPATGLTREVTTTDKGDFGFTALYAGEYKLFINAPGFKRLERSGIKLTTADYLSVGDLTLELGSVGETVMVTAQANTVQTASAERAGVITSHQVENLLIKGRNVTSLLQLLPGVVDLAEDESISRNWNLNVNGGRRANNGVSLDGVALNAIGNNFNMVVGISQDAVAEVKVLLSNYQAEYGRMSGANIQLITKSGTKQFHGLGSYFKRHEQFNANNFFNNRLNQPKPRYRFNTWNYNVGGPVYIPKLFNRNKEKLFFFWSQEYWPQRVSLPLTQLTVPTELERQGDFSQSLDLNGRLRVIRDPTTGQAFPDNRIPVSRINPNGQALLKFFPAANFFDRAISAGRYNYVFQTENTTPQRTETLKLDYLVNAANIVTVNFTAYSDVQEGAIGIASSGGTNWPQLRKKFDNQGRAFLGRYQRIFSPTLVNEFNVGFIPRPADDVVTDSEVQRNTRETIGFNVSQFNPGANPLNLVPNATFGGVQQAANLTIEGRFPLVSTHDSFSLTDSVTKVFATHTIKMGFYYDRIWRNASNAVTFNGSFDFGVNASNPLDTGYAYSNAILGNFNSYTEATSRPFVYFRLSNIEWFVQDNWRATRRLTLDYGLRFYRVIPIYERDNQVSGFFPNRFDAGRQPALIVPVRVNNQRVGRDPLTGTTYPANAIGALAPGSGDPSNGMVVTERDSNVPRALIRDRGVQYAPRLGFAYDVFGNGKTAVRGGFGIFYNRQNLDAVLNPFTSQAPIVETPVINFGNLSTFLNSSGLLFPQNVLGIDESGKVPNNMNFSLSVQHNVAFDTILDVAYVGALGRHLLWQRNLNSIPFDANFKPENADPTNPATPLPQAFLRPLRGYGNINYREWAATSNYHSLQVSANRRFAEALQFGLSWTWSKSLDFTSGDTDSVSALVPVRVWNYGLSSFDRTHVLKLNWLWDLPKTSEGNRLTRGVLNDWQMSGIASFVSGAPLGVGFTTVTPLDITGSPTDGARVVVTGNPVLSKSEQTFSRFFNTGVFALPKVGSIGNSAKTVIRGPGINNWDAAIFKTFPLRESLRLQFRWEMYNVFNHTQFSAVDTNARFDAAGNQVNTRFGELTAARNPRQMQFALRLNF